MTTVYFVRSEEHFGSGISAVFSTYQKAAAYAESKAHETGLEFEVLCACVDRAASSAV